MNKDYNAVLIEEKESLMYRTKNNFINISHGLEYCKEPWWQCDKKSKEKVIFDMIERTVSLLIKQ